MSKGIFIPDITVEMIRKAPLEAIETLLVEGEMHDMDMSKWTPCSEQSPKRSGRYLCTNDELGGWVMSINIWHNDHWLYAGNKPIAWMPLPKPWEGEKG